MPTERKLSNAANGLVAVVDLGSNSFHLVVAQESLGHLQIVDRLRERVALAEGLDSDRRLSETFVERGIECLKRFGQRLRDMPPTCVRVVATNTLRQARNARAVQRRFQAALGHTIEVVSGREEARLIYLGVAHSNSAGARRKLVVDIGGGSTECILGEDFEPLEADSLQMGCVSWSRRFFARGKVTEDGWKRAEIAAGLELQGLGPRYQRLGWEACMGSSGTIVAVEEMLRLEGWSQGGITPRALHKLKQALLDTGDMNKLELAGLHEDRRSVLPGGVAILCAVFESLRIEHLNASQGAMREGVLLDLLGRIRHEDARDQTIRQFQRRYHVDLEHAGRVERTALGLWEKVCHDWSLEDEEVPRFLGWAAGLSEIGLSIAYSGHHKHGAYIVANADMPGFSREEQEIIAALIRFQRRKVLRANLELASDDQLPRLLHMIAIVRLAVLLNRSRSSRPLPNIEVRASKGRLALNVDARWLAAHPLTHVDLREEARAMADLDLRLVLSGKRRAKASVRRKK